MNAPFPSSGATSLTAAPAQQSTSVKSILDAPVTKNKASVVSNIAFAYLFMSLVQYAQSQSTTIAAFESRLQSLGIAVGSRLLELAFLRDSSLLSSLKKGLATTSTPESPNARIIEVLQIIHAPLWRAWFGKEASKIMQSTENKDEYMIVDHSGGVRRYVSEPKEWEGSGCTAAFMAGMVKAVLDGFRMPARVTAHPVPDPEYPQSTTILVKFNAEVLNH